MIFKGLLKKRETAEERLYGAIVATARHEVFYADWAVADSLDGRFDMIALHLFLVLDRLKGEIPEFRQELVDTFFRDMDRSLREMGVGDLTVGKKVRKMAEVFYGRVAAYEKALGEDHGALRSALARNVYPDGAPDEAVAKLAAYAITCREALAGQAAANLAKGEIAFPAPQP